MAKALVATRFPHRVECGELSAFLDTVEALTHDNIEQAMGMGPTLRLLCSVCAYHLGDSSLAEGFALSELAFNLNPVKQQRSHMSFAQAQWLGKQQE